MIPLKVLTNDVAVVAAAAAGGLALQATGLPAGLLTGSMLAVMLAGSVLPLKDLSRPTSDAAMLLTGVVIGAAATPEALRAAAHYPGSILLLLLSILLTFVLVGLFLARLARWSPLDALLGAAPGAFSAVMAVAIEKGGRTGDVAVIQLFRLFLLVAAAPSLVAAAGSGLAGARPLAAPEPIWLDAGVMTAAGLAVAMLFRRIGVMSPMVLGGATASVILHATDLVHGGLPFPVALFAFVALGAMIGRRIATLEWRSLLSLLPVAFGAFLVSTAVAIACAWPASLLAKVSFEAAFIAFAPGGLEVMALVAVALGLDPLYVGAHHLVRFMAVGFLLPAGAALVLRAGKDGVD